MNQPRPGFCSPVKVTRVIDADTIEVELTRRFNVRLVHENYEGKYFNAPEKNTTEGIDAANFVDEVIEEHDDNAVLFIPTGEDQKLMDFNSFSRILGEIWVDGERLTDLLIEYGYGELK